MSENGQDLWRAVMQNKVVESGLQNTMTPYQMECITSQLHLTMD